MDGCALPSGPLRPSLFSGRAVPNLLDRSQRHAIHGVLNCNQHHRVLPARGYPKQDYPKIEDSFGLHFDQGASLEFRTFPWGLNINPQPSPLAAFEAAGMSFSVWQLTNRRPFILFGHVPDYNLGGTDDRLCAQYDLDSRGERPPWTVMTGTIRLGKGARREAGSEESR
jgi:hypothetical protein